MIPLLRILPASVLALASLSAQGQLATEAACKAAAPSGAPCVYQIDPPNWWTGMPAPLLLLYGRNLEGAQFSVDGASVTRARVTDGGHYALLNLAIGAAPGTVRVHIRTPYGAVTLPWRVDAPRPASDGFAGFSSKDVLYLIMTDRFADGAHDNDGPEATDSDSSPAAVAERARPFGWHGGDLRGLTQHLDYLHTLGVTAVWITPVYANEHEPDSYHGYGGSDLYKVDPHFGTLDDLHMLSAELHRRRMKLVLDMVPNHVGPGNPWVHDEPEPDWFHGTFAHHDVAVGEFTPLVNPHAPWRDQKDILDGWFADILPDMNQENPDVSQYLIQNTAWWVEQAAADGIRIDTFPYVGRPFWHAYHATLHEIFPQLTSVGEVFNGNPVITSAFAGGVTRTDLSGDVDTGLWTPFDFPSFFTLRNVLLNGKPMTALAEELGQDAMYPHPERLVPFLGNHDTMRFMSAPGASADRMRLGFGILLTMRGMPQIYSGDELAMTGGKTDPDNRHDFPGGFPGQPHDAFTASGRTAEEQDMYAWVHQLLLLRAAHTELQTGEEQVLQAGADTLAYVRGAKLNEGCSAGPRILVLAARPGAPAALQIAMRETALQGCTTVEPLLPAASSATLGAGGTLALKALPGISIVEVR